MSSVREVLLPALCPSPRSSGRALASLGKRLLAGGGRVQIARPPKTLLPHRQAGQGLDHDAVGVQGRRVARIDAWSHLDHFEAHHVGFMTEPPDDREHLAGREAAWLRSAGTRSVGGVEHVDVKREEEELGALERLADGLLHDTVEAVKLDLCHEVGAHSLLAHPVEKLVVRVVAPQADLYEGASRNVLVFDEAAARR